MKPVELLQYIHAPEDDRFDLAYPPEIRAKSKAHWTPVSIARRAAEFLVREPGTRVLDIGCGPGKFCIVGALGTEGRFTGIEQRQDQQQNTLCAADFCRVVVEKNFHTVLMPARASRSVFPATIVHRGRLRR
mgnify:CR=1 FL=1